MNRRHLLVVAALALAGALLFPSMAAPLSEERDQVSEDIVLEPYGGPNGAYAVMYDQDSDGNEELGLDFSASNPAVDGDGVNAGSLTPVHRVFVIENTDEEPATVYLTDDNDDITFYRAADTGDSLEGELNAVVLAPNDTLVVGVLIDARDGDGVENVEQFTVHADPAESEREVEENGGGDNGDNHNDGGGGGNDISILSTPTETPTGDGTERTDSPTTNESDADGSTETDGGSGGGGDAETNGTTTTVTLEQAGTTLSPVESAAELQQDPGTSGDAGVSLGGLPWWLVLLALLVAAAIGGYGYRRLGA